MKPCCVEGCTKPARGGQMCSAHYFKHNMEAKKAAGRTCTIEGCSKPEFIGGLCRGHYGRKMRGRPVEGPLNPLVKPDAFVRFRLPKTAIAKLNSEAVRLAVKPDELLSIFVLRSLGLQR